MNVRKWFDVLFSLNGTVDRGTFLLCGAILFACKLVIDRFVAWHGFGIEWSPWNYLAQEQVVLISKYGRYRADQPFVGTMLGLAIPFVWTGIALTTKRLRDMGMPSYWVLLLFAPYINFLCFAVLSMTPSKKPQRDRNAFAKGAAESGFIRRVMPEGACASAALAVLVTTIVGTLYMGFSVYVLEIYGLGLFIGLPFCLGMGAALLAGSRAQFKVGASLGVALLSVASVGGVLLGFGWEGAGCLIMASPLWILVGGLGGLVAHGLRRLSMNKRELALVIVGLTLLVPALMGAEFLHPPHTPEFAIRSTVEIDATRERVWQHVVSFPDLGPPTETVFAYGIAYPKSATIEGVGVGAVRRCKFSTGDFVEPIEVWDEPTLLRFAVTENPPPMQEWSFHEHVDAPHLHGFMQSKRGQFHLIENADGSTKLEGTTWYSHNMQPAGYWRLWSDYMIHEIHLRVLRHIELLAEESDA